MKKRILVCDDDEGILDICKIVLQDKGYEVLTTDGFDEICKFAIKTSPDLILLDLWMPGIGGKETAKILKRNLNTSSIPIVIISASKDAARDATEAGADACLNKPFDIMELERTVARYL